MERIGDVTIGGKWVKDRGKMGGEMETQ